VFLAAFILFYFLSDVRTASVSYTCPTRLSALPRTQLSSCWNNPEAVRDPRRRRRSSSGLSVGDVGHGRRDRDRTGGDGGSAGGKPPPPPPGRNPSPAAARPPGNEAVGERSGDVTGGYDVIVGGSCCCR